MKDITFDIDKDSEITVYLDAVLPLKSKARFNKMLAKNELDTRRRARNRKTLRLYLQGLLNSERGSEYKKNLRWLDAFERGCDDKTRTAKK